MHIKMEWQRVFGGSTMCTISTDGTTGHSVTKSLRPVFTLKTTLKVTDGEGTSSKPYQLTP